MLHLKDALFILGIFFNYKINEVLMILGIVSAHWDFQNNFF